MIFLISCLVLLATVFAAAIYHLLIVNLKTLEALAGCQRPPMQLSGQNEDQETLQRDLNNVRITTADVSSNMKLGENRSRSWTNRQKANKVNCGDSEEYWASNDESSEDNKCLLKKVRVRRTSHARYGATDGSDSSASDRDRPTQSQAEKQLSLEMEDVYEQNVLSDQKFLSANYSGDESQKLLNSETTAPADNNMPYYDPKASYDCVVLRLQEEISTLKKESASNQKRAANILSRLRGEKDQEIVNLKKEIQIRDQQIHELVKQLKQDRITSEQVEQLRMELDASLREFRRDRPAEEIPIGSYEADDSSEFPLHRPLAQDLQL